MKKVVHLSIRHQPLDIRIFKKECITLKKNNYDVTYIVPHEEDKVIQGIKIVALKKFTKTKYNVLFNIPNSLIKSISVKADIYHIHDPELIPIGIILKIIGKKLIYDVHENYPKEILEKKWPYSLKLLISSIFTLNEFFASVFFDHIIAVIPQIGDKFPHKKTSIIRNVPILGSIDNVVPVNYKTKNTILVYQGGITKLRGIKNIILALEFLKDPVEFWIFGKWEKNLLEDCKKLKVWKKVIDHGEMPQNILFSYLKRADIGLITFFDTPNNRESLPNKSFEYISCGLPIIISNFPLWKKYFQNCALFVDPSSPKDIAEKIKILIDNKILRENLVIEGKKLIENEYSWEKESKKLIDLYRRF